MSTRSALLIFPLFMFSSALSCPQSFSYSITKQWNGVPINHQPLNFTLSSTPDFRGVKFEVQATLFNDPGPPPCPSGQACQNLWDYEVAEIFFLGLDEKYLEVEVSPHGQHLVLLLNGVRKPFRTMLRMSYSATKDELSKRWSGTAIIPLEYFPPGIAAGKMNAYSIYGSGSKRVYEALYPAPKSSSTPDFHRLELFKPLNFKAMFPSSWTQPESNYWKGALGANGAK